MRVLAVHNYYQQRGGEDQIYEAESSMLENHGCRVFSYKMHNNLVKEKNLLALTQSTLWNRTAFNQLWKIIKQKKPDVVHFHNIFPLISPAAYYAAKTESIPVIQTLHNYRLLCLNALLFRNGLICEDCVGKFVSWPGILNVCYRKNLVATSVTAATLSLHRVLCTYRKMVDIYIALTNFARQKFIQGGLPAEKIVVKPNFIYPDPGAGNGDGGYALFVGRLSPEKGINIFLSAWSKTIREIPLKVVGNGPLSFNVAEAARTNSKITWLGQQSRHTVLRLMKDASILIFPSICYEGMPTTIIDAFSVGLPVIASNVGGISSMIEYKRTGLFFNPGDSEDLASKTDWIFSHPKELIQMRRAVRAVYEAKYSAEINYEMLMNIYETAIERSRKKVTIQL